MLELKHHCECVWKIQHEGVCGEANTAQGKAECCICLETSPKCCIFHTHKHRWYFNCYIVLPGRLIRVIFSSTQTAATFGDQDISKCLTNLFLVVERTNRISLASFSDLQCHAHDQLCCLSGIVFKKLHDQTISKCLYSLFLGIERTRRISLAGFNNLQCVVYGNIP